MSPPKENPPETAATVAEGQRRKRPVKASGEPTESLLARKENLRRVSSEPTWQRSDVVNASGGGDAAALADAPPPAAIDQDGGSPWLHGHIVSLSSRGMVLKEVLPVVNLPKTNGLRGKITEFSHHSCRRLREYLLNHDGPAGFQVWAYSLTVPGEVSADEWRTALRRWSKIVQRAGCCAVWRVELQRRKQPHLHVILWVPPGTKGWRVCSEDWLDRCLPERCRSVVGALTHAAQGALMPGSGNLEWFAYLVAHSSKHKATQLGWQGRQWGVVNRAILRDVRQEAERIHLTDTQRWKLQRLLRRMLGFQGRKARAFRRWGGWCRIVDAERIRKAIAWVKSVAPDDPF